MRVFEFRLLEDGDMSGNITSIPQQLNSIAMASIQAVWTGGSASGSLKLQISNDNVTYSDYTGSSTPVSGAGDFIWNIVATPYPWIRVVYTRTSGTGLLNITVNGKGV